MLNMSRQQERRKAQLAKKRTPTPIETPHVWDRRFVKRLAAQVAGQVFGLMAIQISPYVGFSIMLLAAAIGVGAHYWDLLRPTRRRFGNLVLFCIGALLVWGALMFAIRAYSPTEQQPSQQQAQPPASPLPADIDNLEVKLVVRGYSGPDIVGHFQLHNKTNTKLSISSIIYQTKRTLASHSEPLPRNMGPGGRLNIPIASGNALAAGTSARLQFNYRFHPGGPNGQGFAQFENNGGFPPGAYDPVFFCEKSANLPGIKDEATSEMFTKKVGGFRIQMDERVGPKVISSGDHTQFFTFDPIHREIGLAVDKGGRQVVLRADLPRTPDGIHTIEADWKGKPTLTVDGTNGSVIRESR
jgi:hypothetical protein